MPCGGASECGAVIARANPTGPTAERAKLGGQLSR